MISPNPIIGTGLHAVGGISAATCYLPSNFIKKWSWGTFWLAQAFFAWIVAPLVIGWATVPNFFHLLFNAPKSSMLIAFSLGAAYGFGGLSFGKAIIHIGYSLTYTLAIGISAVVGTLLPLAVLGGMNDYFSQPGSGIVILGMMMSVIGVALCGWAGFKKEKDIISGPAGKAGFNMAAGLLLTIVAGILSGVFNLSLEFGQPIAELAAENGAGHYEGNAKLIVSTSGCFLTNFIWFTAAGYRNNTLHEIAPRKIQTSGKTYLGNWSLSALTGTLWSLQFFFYGLGHVKMGNFQFASWALHMSMLIFFSYIVGLVMKEWKNVSRNTFLVLLAGLTILIVSFCITGYGSYYGQSIVLP